MEKQFRVEYGECDEQIRVQIEKFECRKLTDINVEEKKFVQKIGTNGGVKKSGSSSQNIIPQSLN